MGWDWQKAWNDGAEAPDGADTRDYAISKEAYYDARRRWQRLLPDFRTKEQARERMRVREKGSKNPAPQDRKREHCLLLTDRRLLEDGFPEDQPGDQRLLSVMNVYESSKQRKGGNDF